jgi:phosphomannomutase/phosphoglucomutase
MKLTPPSFFKGRQAKGHAPSPGAGPTPAKPAIKGQRASLDRVKLQIMIASVVLLAVLTLFIFQFSGIYISRIIDQDSGRLTERFAAQVESLVDFYGSSVDRLAGDMATAEMLITRDEAALRERGALLTTLYPAAINVQLLPPGIDQVNPDAMPPLSYAALAQMREAEGGQQPPLAEVHLLNTPQQHINIIRRVTGPASDRVVGLIMLSLSGEALAGALGGARQLNGYVELQQTGAKGAPVTVSQQGDPAFRDGEPITVAAVRGSRWQVAYWPAQSGAAFLARISLWVIAAFLVMAIVMAAITLMLFKRLSGALNQDRISLVNLAKDVRDGQVRHEYPYGLNEMRETMEFITRIVSVVRGSDGREDNEEQPVEQATAVDKIEEHAPAEAGQNSGSHELSPDYATLQGESMKVEEGPLEFTAEHETEVKVDASIFRAYDVRGVVNQTLTPETVKLIGRAIGSEAIQRGRNTVVVGRDGRLSGPALSRALIAGLTATGCDVVDIGVVPTPVLYFAANYLDVHQTGVVVTGSHNPPDYNGLKIMIDGETLSGKSIQHLRERIESGNFISGQGKVQEMDIISDYIERIRSDVKLERPLRVVVDCGNGVAGAVAPQLLKAIGCEVTELFCEVDGNFPNHHPDPSKTENLKDLIEAVRQTQADIGLAFDGDGDRLGVVTNEGNIIWPDRVLMLFAGDILDRNPGGLIIYDVKCSRFLDGIIREHGGEPLMWKTGHSFIKAKIKETGALLAGEMSGHIFFKERWYGFDDGLYAAARLLEILGKDERPATEVFASLPDSVNTPELNVAMQEGEPPRFIERLLASAHFEGAQVSTIDGLRADFEDGWGLVRASNTTPVLVLRFEADDQAALTRIMEDFRRVLLQTEPGLSLPF